MSYVGNFCECFSGTRDIDDVLIGDKCVKAGGLSLCMPRLSGSDIYCGLRKMFNMPLNGRFVDKKDRWQYMEDFIYDGFYYNTINSILTYLFSMGRMKDLYSSKYCNLVDKYLSDISGLSIVYFIRDINDVLSSFDSFLSCHYRIVERSKKFYIDSNEEKYFDAYLDQYDRLYKKYSLPKLLNAFINPGNKDNHTSHHENSTNIYAHTINSRNFETNVTNYNYYFDPKSLNSEIESKVDELEKRLSKTQYKSYPIKSGSYMRNGQYSKALKLLKEIPQGILKTKNILSAVRYLIKFCGLFL